jgi:aminopeptidase N
LACDKSKLFLAPMDSSDARKYAPDREIDILNLALDLTPDFKQRTIAGKATLSFKPIAKPLAELRLDAVDLNIQKVDSAAKIQGYEAAADKLVVTFAEPIPPGQETAVTIEYSAQPSKGLYFRTPEMGYKKGDTHLFTQGEAIEARHWYPCYDSPNEKFTSEVTCHVPEGMIVLSNGKLLSEEKDSQTELVTVHWRQDKPHVAYLVSLVAGYFKKVEDQYRDIPLAFYTPASEINEAGSSFRDTKEAMAYFEEEIGVPYPWAKYYQVCVNDFVAGGMENTSITTLTDRTLFTEATENIRTSQGLVAHELAHQWFGDLVTCKDWSHVWLNEGFATYYAHLFDGHKNGRDSMLYGLFADAQGIVNHPDDTKPIVNRKYSNPDEQFSYLAYPKGGWVLHMLRSQLGESLYRRCIRTYLERHQYGTVVTEDLNSVIEELSGRSYDRFFDQWVYHAHNPELDISYSWDERNHLAKISVGQNQKLSEEVLLFQFPLTVRFKTSTGTVDRQLNIRDKSEDFYVSLPEAPKLVRIDPELTLLAKIKFTPSDPMLKEQLADEKDVIGRVLAVQQLGTQKDHASVDALKSVLKNDSFYGVRAEAARALRGIHSDEAFSALNDGLEQPDARVRQQVVAALTGFYRDEAFAAAAQELEREKNPDILAEAIRGYGASSRPEVRDRLITLLDSKSYRHSLADASISAMRAQDDPAYVPPLMKSLRERQADFTSSGFRRGLEALAYLDRNEEKKDSVREFLLGYVNDRKKTVQLGAITALGTLGDPKAIAVLETFASGRKDNPEHEAADKSIQALRAAKKPNDEWRDLRKEVLDLEQANRELKKEVETLKKRLDATESKASEKKARKAQSGKSSS